MEKAKKMLLILEEAERIHFKYREQNRNKGKKVTSKATQTEDEWLTIYKKTKDERCTETLRGKRDDMGKHQDITTISTPSRWKNHDVDKVNKRNGRTFATR